MLPALPTGGTPASGGAPSTSQTSKAPVFWPSMRSGFTELTRVTSSRSAAISCEILSAASKLPSICTISAPCASTWTALPKAIFPAGTTTKHLMPARAAYAAAEAAVFPVEAQTAALLPEATARLMATVIPRSLNEAVGFIPSNFKKRLAPTRSESVWASIRGVSPSPMVVTASSGMDGNQPRNRRITPCLNTRVCTPIRDPPFSKRRPVLYRANAVEDSPRKYRPPRRAFKKRGDGMPRLVDYVGRLRAMGFRHQEEPETYGPNTDTYKEEHLGKAKTDHPGHRRRRVYRPHIGPRAAGRL